jgi:hypothetical protein
MLFSCPGILITMQSPIVLGKCDASTELSLANRFEVRRKCSLSAFLEEAGLCIISLTR